MKTDKILEDFLYFNLDTELVDSYSELDLARIFDFVVDGNIEYRSDVAIAYMAVFGNSGLD